MCKPEVVEIIDRLNRVSCYVNIVSDLLNRYDQNSIVKMTNRFQEIKVI